MPRSYQKLFKQKSVITNLNGKPLPLGLKFTSDDISTFLVSIPIWILILLSPIGLLLKIWFNPVVIVAVGAGLTTWVAHKIDPDGKPLLLYLKDALFYFCRSHVSNGWERLPRSFAKRNGWKRKKIQMRVKRSWTDHNVPLPAVARSGDLRFENQVHVDVEMKAGRTVFKQSKGHRLPSRHKAYGLRPGTYSVQDQDIKREK